MRILGIDPGYATIGFGLIEAARGQTQMLNYGAISTPPGVPFPRRLEILFDDMTTLLKETLKHNFGVEVDGCVVIDFSHFEQLIDLLGGIELELTGAEARFVNVKSGSRLTAGVHTLSGKEALWFSRFRGTATGDLARSSRQRIVLTTLLNEYKNKSLTELLSLVDDILPMVTTDLTQKEILGYAKDFFPMLATAEICSYRIPVDGSFSYAKISGMEVIVPNITKNADELHRILSEFPEGVG